MGRPGARVSVKVESPRSHPASPERVLSPGAVMQPEGKLSPETLPFRGPPSVFDDGAGAKE